MTTSSRRAGRATRGLAALLAAALALGPSGAWAQRPDAPVINLPRLGDASADELSPAAERRVGEQIMADLRREGIVHDDAEIADWLNRFAAALTAQPDARGFSFEFFLVRDTSLNAFALPGGFIGVHTGLVQAAQAESELAAVLAHEIGHVTQRHIARMLSNQRQSSVFLIAAVVLAALAARSNPQAVPGIALLGAGAQQDAMLAFSRDAEREADRVGIELLRGAGFDANGMAAFFGRLQAANRLMESSAPAYVRTHPLTTERMADMQARVRETRYRQRADGVDFRLVRAKLRALADPSVDGLRAQRQRLESALRDRSAPDELAAWFSLAHVAAAQRDWPGAERALGEVRRRLSAQVVATSTWAGGTPGSHPFVERLVGAMRLAQNDPRAALEIARAGVQKYPGARAFVHLQAEALLAAGEARRAADELEQQLLVTRADPRLWDLLGRARAALGQTTAAHRAAAERYVLLGALPAAIEQLRLAQRAGDADFFVVSQVDARLRDLQAEAELLRQEGLRR